MARSGRADLEFGRLRAGIPNGISGSRPPDAAIASPKGSPHGLQVEPGATTGPHG